MIINKVKTPNKNNFSCNNVAISLQWPRDGWISKHLVFQVDALLADGAELTALGHEHDQEGDGAAAQEPEALIKSGIFNYSAIVAFIIVLWW